jgi:hypothetical protein
MREEKIKPVFFMLHPVANQKAILLASSYRKKGKNTRSAVGVSEGWLQSG